MELKWVSNKITKLKNFSVPIFHGRLGTYKSPFITLLRCPLLRIILGDLPANF